MRDSDSRYNNQDNKDNIFSISNINIKKEFVDIIMSRFIVEWNSIREGENCIAGPTLFLLRRLMKKYYPNNIKSCSDINKDTIYKFYIDAGIYYVPLDYTTFCRIKIDNNIENGRNPYVIGIIGLRAKFWYIKIRKFYNKIINRIDTIDNDKVRILS